MHWYESKVKITKILVAIDGSDQSIKAAEYGIDIANRYGAQLIALTVLDISKIRYSSSALIVPPSHTLEELQRMRKEAQSWLDMVGKLTEQRKDFSNKGGNTIQFKSQIEESMSVAGTIVEYAEIENIDLTIVGSRGRSGFKKLLLGSVASTVVTYATCSVLVIK